MHPADLKAAFDRGENITELLRREYGSAVNTEEIIEMAYDLQTGSYVAALEDPVFRDHKMKYGSAIAEVLTSLVYDGGSVLEPGVGEGTTLSFVIEASGSCFDQFHGFDISWSRIAQCRDWLTMKEHDNVFLSVASIFHGPYADDSFDIVYTSHTAEPNGGREIPILKELYRMASQYLVLFEPGFEFASLEAQERMKKLGYVRGLKDHAVSLGMKVIKHDLFGLSANPLNPTAVTIIEKKAGGPPALPRLACPRFGDLVTEYGDSLYSPGSLRAYPKIVGIPCLRLEDGIVASQYETYARQDSGTSSVR